MRNIDPIYIYWVVISHIKASFGSFTKPVIEVMNGLVVGTQKPTESLRYFIYTSDTSSSLIHPVNELFTKNISEAVYIP